MTGVVFPFALLLDIESEPQLKLCVHLKQHYFVSVRLTFFQSLIHVQLDRIIKSLLAEHTSIVPF